ncbi:MAG TPA: hemerythrin domain-containing protein [Burkholderiales bacterium]
MGRRSRADGTQDAIAFLLEDHRKLRAMFEDYDRLVALEAGEDCKGRLSAQVCAELALHMQIEEDAFYPAVRAALGDGDPLGEAGGEHQGMRDLMRRLECMEADDRRYDTTVKLLGERVLQHFDEEQDETLPRARAARLDFGELARQMLALKRSLLAEIELAEAPCVEDGMRAASEVSRNGGKAAGSARK